MFSDSTRIIFPWKSFSGYLAPSPTVLSCFLLVTLRFLVGHAQQLYAQVRLSKIAPNTCCAFCCSTRHKHLISVHLDKTASSYGGWKKSCTTLDGWIPINNGINRINQLSTGAGFLPSTVCWGSTVSGTWTCPQCSKDTKSSHHAGGQNQNGILLYIDYLYGVR